MRRIPLTQGKFSIVDDEDFEEMSKFKWCLSGDKRYAAGWVGGRMTYMHRVLTGNDKTKKTDHINRNGLDNRRSNLRLVTNSQNSMNRNSGSNNTSGYKGVTWDKTHNKWKAYIRIDGRQKNLGFFSNKSDSVLAYDKAAKKYFGEFAKTNL